MAEREAKARIKINKLLEEAGWRLLDSGADRANVLLEHRTRITESALDEMGEDFEQTRDGFVDFLLIDSEGAPLAVLEAKREGKHPLSAKEQARDYALSQHCRFVILSNGNMHYFWDLGRGSPDIISRFPAPESIKSYREYQPDAQRLASEPVAADYIALTQMPDYAQQAGWRDEAQRPEFTHSNRLRFMREYQVRAIHALQQSAAEGNTRFLFEMATGTGKTLTAAAAIKLFLRTQNARRVLFLVDRLELEQQAKKSISELLKNDCECFIYKERREDWRKAEIVISTVQSLLFDNKYRSLFSPSDFDFIISDEAHRSITGNARALFEYFLGYKLGLTATPKDYLKNLVAKATEPMDPREMERRILLDTYRTFGCEDSEPTFRYSPQDGARDGHLVNPLVVDARSQITTQLLSEQGYQISLPNIEGEDEDHTYNRGDFERKFFSEPTNESFCRAFMENALRDPISGEIGKSIMFTVSQNHAAKITNILNHLADGMFSGMYHSDFAMQVTSHVENAQKFAVDFANNRLAGYSGFVDSYKTSKARVCVTVGMMTTGYDCTDILNLGLMRPIFSPTDFVQMKGRGTRLHDFSQQLDTAQRRLVGEQQKQRFKLFDFFGNFEYFEHEFNYDEVLDLPPPGSGSGAGGSARCGEEYENFAPDPLETLAETQIGSNGMKVDRKLFDRFQEAVLEDAVIRRAVERENWGIVNQRLREHIWNKPEHYFTLEKLRIALGVDRRLEAREMVERALGIISRFKSRAEVLDEEFAKFVADCKPEEVADLQPLLYFFAAYASEPEIRAIIDGKDLARLHTSDTFTMADYRNVPEKWREAISKYIRDYVSLDQFEE